jgi:hypothetical protein
VDPKQAWQWIQSRLSSGSKAGLAAGTQQGFHNKEKFQEKLNEVFKYLVYR